jgi:murein DD-endopeptidase MepM/ murein hydrolase activator NlpD
MRAVPLLALLLLLGGCGGKPSTPQMPFATETVSAALTSIHLPGSASTPRGAAPTDLPTVAFVGLTPTLPEACDPVFADYCTVDGHFIFNRPIYPPGNDKVEPTYRYGATQNGLREPHHGVEFPNQSGTPVHAVAAGEVVFAGSDKSTLVSPWSNFYGNAVVIKHEYEGFPIFTLYGHLSRIDVQSGQRVAEGQKIGEVGAAGAAIGSHLHFEVRQGENNYASTRNPELWLVPRIGDGTLAIRVTDKMDNALGVQINVQRLLTDGTFEVVTQPEAYNLKEKVKISSDDVYRENFAFGDLPAGTYRLSFVNSGRLYARLVEVESGKLTLVDFTTK